MTRYLTNHADSIDFKESAKNRIISSWTPMMFFLSYLKNVLKFNRGLSGLFFVNHRLIFKEWRDQIESKKYPLDLELPWITILAKNYIEDYLRSRSKAEVRIFEYGSGGSSVFFLKYASEVVSVEHDKKWFDLVKERVREKQIPGWNGQFLEPELIPNSKTKNLDKSNPHDYYTGDKKFSGHTFKKYATYIDNFPDQYFDIVLVDGRSRPSCLFHSVGKIKKGGLLVLDNAEREYYLSQRVINDNDYTLVSSAGGALIAYNQFTQTNIYIKE